MLAKFIVWILFLFGLLESKTVFFSDTFAPYDLSISNSESPYRGNSSYNATDYYKVRYLKGCTINANITIDIKLSIELPSDEGFNGTIEFDIPITITIANRTIFKIPLPDKPLKVPIFYPVIQLPAKNSKKKNKYVKPANPPSQYTYYDDEPNDLYFDYLDRTGHYIAKRSLAANSAKHRFEIFQSLEDALDRHGYDGHSCMLRSICQLAQDELIVESVLHEIIEHLLTVSRSVDEEEMLVEYIQAERMGENGNDCLQLYKCQFSIFQKM